MKPTDADIEAIVGKGLEHYGRGELDVAIGLWQRALEADPENREAREYIDYVSANFEDIERQFVGGGNAFAIDFAGEPGFPLDDESPGQTPTSLPLDATAELDGETAEELDAGWFLDSGAFGGAAVSMTGRDSDDESATNVLGSAGDTDHETATSVLPKRNTDEETAPTIAIGLGPRVGGRDSDNETAPTVSLPGFPRPSKDDQTAPTLAIGGRRPPAPVNSTPGDNPIASLDLSDIDLAPMGLEAGAPDIETEEDSADELVLTMADPSDSGTIDLDESPPALEAGGGDAVSFDDLELDTPIVPLMADSKKPGGRLAQRIDRALADFEEDGSLDIGFDDDDDPGAGGGIEAPTMQVSRERLEAPTLQVTRQRLDMALAGDDDDSIELDPSTRQSPRQRMLTPPPVGDAMSMEAVAQELMNEVDADADSSESLDQAIARRVSLLLEKALDSRVEAPTIAVVAADLALGEAPAAAVAQKLIHDRERELVGLFREHIGDTAAVPVLSVTLDELMNSQLDNRAAFLASRVDGILSFDELLDVSAMPRLEAHRYLSRLLLQGILRVV